MVHILPLTNTPGFTPEFDKKNWLRTENQSGLSVQYIAAGHGIYKRSRWWYDNGQIGGDSNYKNDKLHGRDRWWYLTGQIGRDVNYKNGQRHGRCRWWDESGNLTADEVWENGKLIKG